MINPDRLEECLRKVNTNLPSQLISDVWQGLRLGWSTGYRGFADWWQDFSREEDDEKEELKLEQIQEDRKEGRIAGPFDRPPFPNYWCPHQAKVCKVFSIWKNRLDITDRSIRMINNKSLG